MRYWGKIIGITLGIVSGTHIWGIIIGFIIGHAYDTASEQQNLDKIDSKENCQVLFFVSTFQILGHLTKSKGRVTEVDIKLATNLMDRMHLHSDARVSAQNAFREGKKQTFPLRKTLKKIRRACFGRFELIQMFLEIQIQAAFADGILHPNERRVLFIIAEELGISYTQFENFLYMMETDQRFEYQHGSNYFYRFDCHQNITQGAILLDACKLLGVKPNDEQTKIKRAYHKLMAKHHPDKLVASGLPPKMIEIAKQKAQSIQAAYNLIKKARCFK